MKADRYIVQRQNEYVSRPVDVVRLINKVKFESKKELIDQIKKDKAICQKLLEDQDMKKGDSFLYVNHEW